VSPEDFSDSENLQQINNYTNLTVKAFTVDLPLRYRTGQPLYLQNWGDGNGHGKSWTAGTGAESTIQGNKFLNNRAAWKLTAGSDGGRAAHLEIEQGPYEKAKLRFEWAMTWAADIEYFQFYVIFMDGSNYYWVELYIDVALDEIQIADGTATKQSVRSPIYLEEDEDCWHHFKITVDFSSGKYVELYVNEDTVDLSNYSMYYAASAAGDPIDMLWFVKADDGKNPTIYIDAIAMVLED
jgi:hypothetical protein